jgi:hypothetical protein
MSTDQAWIHCNNCFSYEFVQQYVGECSCILCSHCLQSSGNACPTHGTPNFIALTESDIPEELEKVMRPMDEYCNDLVILNKVLELTIVPERQCDAAYRSPEK